MQFRVSAGEAVLKAAQFIETEEALAPMSVEAPFLLFDFGDLSHGESLSKIDEMDQCLGIKIADSDSDDVRRALTALKRAVDGLRNDLHRENMIRARASEANSTQRISHPLPTGDSVITNSATQSSDAVNEEIENGQAQEQPERRAGRR